MSHSSVVMVRCPTTGRGFQRASRWTLQHLNAFPTFTRRSSVPFAIWIITGQRAKPG